MEGTPFVLSTRQLLALLVVLALLLTGWTLAATRLARAVEPGVPVVYIATGANFPDALAAGALAALSGGPVLFVTRDGIPPATADELERLAPLRITILGGSAVVSGAVETALADYTTGPVDRLAGSDRYATAAEISQALPTSPFAATGHHHEVRRANIGSLQLFNQYQSRSVINFSLEDACGAGNTRWRLFATAHASATALNPNVDVDMTITLNSSEENPDARTRSTLTGAGTVYENMALQAVFTDVEPGEHTLRVLARMDGVINVTLTRGRTTLMIMGYDCI